MIPHVQIITNSPIEFLNYLRSKYSVFHMSNVFYRDLTYGVTEYLAKRNVNVGITKAEAITHEVITNFEKRNILRRVNAQGWVVIYPEFTTPKVVQAPIQK
jgi:hypothetical protein